MSDDFRAIQAVADALLRNLSTGERHKLMRKMARDLAISQRKRITANKAPDGTPHEPRKAQAAPRRRQSLRRDTMFRRLATPKYMKVQTSAEGFSIGFTGPVATIARVHHYGLRDRPSLKSQMVEYPKRELLGATDGDTDQLINLLMSRLGTLAEF